MARKRKHSKPAAKQASSPRPPEPKPAVKPAPRQTRRSPGRSRWVWIGAAVIAVLVGAVWLSRRDANPAEPGTDARAGAPVPLAEASLAEDDGPRRDRVVDSHQIDVADDPRKGPSDALVRIVEFADYECPSCGQFFRTTQGALTSLYGDRIEWVFVDFPLTQVHTRALPAAVAGACADRQAKFWAYHDLLFQNQERLADRDLRRYAKEAGLDEAAWQRCFDNQETLAGVQQDIKLGEELGVSGTPTFYVGGETIHGAAPVTSFMEVIDPILRTGAPAPTTSLGTERRAGVPVDAATPEDTPAPPASAGGAPEPDAAGEAPSSAGDR